MRDGAASATGKPMAASATATAASTRVLPVPGGASPNNEAALGTARSNGTASVHSARTAKSSRSSATRLGSASYSVKDLARARVHRGLGAQHGGAPWAVNGRDVRANEHAAR